MPKFEAAKRIFEMADHEALARVCPKLEDLMRSESVSIATAAAAVSSLVGWFYTTLDGPWRMQFEELIEAQFEIGHEYNPEKGQGW